MNRRLRKIAANIIGFIAILTLYTGFAFYEIADHLFKTSQKQEH